MIGFEIVTTRAMRTRRRALKPTVTGPVVVSAAVGPSQRNNVVSGNRGLPRRGVRETLGYTATIRRDAAAGLHSKRRYRRRNSEETKQNVRTVTGFIKTRVREGLVRRDTI